MSSRSYWFFADINVLKKTKNVTIDALLFTLKIQHGYEIDLRKAAKKEKERLWPFLFPL